jgi:uncharacterized integral membrane protein
MALGTRIHTSGGSIFKEAYAITQTVVVLPLFLALVRFGCLAVVLEIWLLKVSRILE